MAYILTKHEIEQELFAFSHFQEKIESDFYEGKINGGQYSDRLTALVREYAARISQPHKAKWPNSNWKLVPMALVNKRTFDALDRIVEEASERHFTDDDPLAKDVAHVFRWMDKVEGDYSEQKASKP